VEDDVYAIRGPVDVTGIQHRTGLELYIQPGEGFGQATWLQDANPLAHFDQAPHQDVAETAATTCNECNHAAQ